MRHSSYAKRYQATLPYFMWHDLFHNLCVRAKGLAGCLHEREKAVREAIAEADRVTAEKEERKRKSAELTAAENEAAQKRLAMEPASSSGQVPMAIDPATVALITQLVKDSLSTRVKVWPAQVCERRKIQKKVAWPRE